MKEADDIPLYLPLIKGANPQLPNIKAPAWYLEKYGIESVDDLAGPLKTVLVDGKTVRALSRTIGDASIPVLFVGGLVLTVLPNLITNVREKRTLSNTLADIIIDGGGYFVSEIAGWTAGGIAFLSGWGTWSTLGVKLSADLAVSVVWDINAENNNWSERLSSWIDTIPQKISQNILNSFENAIDVNQHPPSRNLPSLMC